MTESFIFRTPRLGEHEPPLTPAERGIATHTLLQYIDYSRAADRDGILSEIARLRSMGQLSPRQAEAVEPEKVLRLFSSPTGIRIRNADRVSRELRFSLLSPAEEYFDGGEGESVLLQGVIDCCIEEDGELTVIDYKTDRVRGDAVYERAELYRSQLSAYASAMERMTGKPVRECVLYFLDCGKAIKL